MIQKKQKLYHLLFVGMIGCIIEVTHAFNINFEKIGIPTTISISDLTARVSDLQKEFQDSILPTISALSKNDFAHVQELITQFTDPFIPKSTLLTAEQIIYSAKIFFETLYERIPEDLRKQLPNNIETVLEAVKGILTEKNVSEVLRILGSLEATNISNISAFVVDIEARIKNGTLSVQGIAKNAEQIAKAIAEMRTIVNGANTKPLINAINTLVGAVQQAIDGKLSEQARFAATLEFIRSVKQFVQPENLLIARSLFTQIVKLTELIIDFSINFYRDFKDVLLTAATEDQRKMIGDIVTIAMNNEAMIRNNVQTVINSMENYLK